MANGSAQKRRTRSPLPASPPREKHAAESFEIDGVVFEYPIGHHYGYDKTYYEGGVIRWEGKILRIGYIPYEGDNLIVLIQEP